MPNPIIDQRIFMNACDQLASGTTSEGDPQYVTLYTTLMQEEYGELLEALSAPDYDRAAICKEIIDCIVVLLGLGYSYGFDMQRAWDIVHENNMTKVDIATGKVRRRYDGKVQKPAGYTKPDMTPAVAT